ncbi:MAG: transketolase family protein, partial [Caldimicrobium sp.]
GGLSSAIAELIVEENCAVFFDKIALPDRFIEHGDLKTLREKYGFSVKNIKEKIYNLIEKI